MPITDNGYEYQMPDGIRDQLTKELLNTLHENASSIFNIPKDEMDNLNYYALLENTGGWREAFKSACTVHDKNWLYEYYYHLPWYESDIFAGDVGDMMVKHGVIEDGDPNKFE